MVTLRDIAKQTGVSVNTVSRALKDMPDIGAATKTRVVRTARQLGYSPNVMARGLVLRRAFAIGVIATELNNPSRSMLIQQLRLLAASKGYHLLVSGFDSECDVGARIREMTARGIDGLIIGNIDGVLAEEPFWPDLDRAVKAGIPAVAFFHTLTTRIDNVSVDYAAIARSLTRHLIECHGRRNVLFTGVDLRYPRGAGYARAMKAAGLTKKIGVIPLAYWNLRETRREITEYVKRRGAPDGVVCHNDLAAIGVIAGLRDAGLRVPEDVAVAGIDNIEMTEHLNPALTTAGVDPVRVAGELFRMLSDRISGAYSGKTRQVKLDAPIFLRESCGCRIAGLHQTADADRKRSLFTPTRQHGGQL